MDFRRQNYCIASNVIKVGDDVVDKKEHWAKRREKIYDVQILSNKLTLNDGRKANEFEIVVARKQTSNKLRHLKWQKKKREKFFRFSFQWQQMTAIFASFDMFCTLWKLNELGEYL